MGEPLLENLLPKQKRATALKEELSRSLSWVITPKLSYPLIRILFFYKNLCYKQSIDENLNKKVITGFWCKGINAGNLSTIASEIRWGMTIPTLTTDALQRARLSICKGSMLASDCYNWIALWLPGKYGEKESMVKKWLS